MTTPPPDPKHSCVSRFFRRRQRSPLLHLGWVGGRGEGLHFPAALLPVSELPLIRLLTSPLVNNAVSVQLIHSWGGERPIQFIPHIKGLKCSRVIWRETVISTVNLSGGSHSMLPNQCRPYGRQKVRHRKQTNKEVRTNIMINWWLCPSQQPAGLNYWRSV